MPNSYGYSQILMKPPQSIINNKVNDTSKLQFASASLTTVKGYTAIEWKASGNSFYLGSIVPFSS